MALKDAAQKVQDGFRFKLKDISPLLVDYPNLDTPKYQALLNEWSENCTKHILQTFSAVTKASASYAQEFDVALNQNPELAAIFKESEDFHFEMQAKDIRENPESTKYRTTPKTW